MYQNNQQMRNIKQLNQAIDSLKKEVSESRIANKKRNASFFSICFLCGQRMEKSRYPDSIAIGVKPAKSFDEVLPDSLRNFINEKARATGTISKFNK